MNTVNPGNLQCCVPHKTCFVSWAVRSDGTTFAFCHLESLSYILSVEQMFVLLTPNSGGRTLFGLWCFSKCLTHPSMREITPNVLQFFLTSLQHFVDLMTGHLLACFQWYKGLHCAAKNAASSSCGVRQGLWELGSDPCDPKPWICPLLSAPPLRLWLVRSCFVFASRCLE